MTDQFDFASPAPPPVSPLNPPERLLFGPGPTPVHPRVMRAMTAPILGHLDPALLAIMDEVAALLRYVFGTENPATFAVSGTGTSGMETALVNTIEPGDAVVIGVNGAFGSRMVEIANKFGARVTKVEAPWGEPIDPAQFLSAIEQTQARVAALVHAETSTGVLQPLDEIGQGIRARGDDTLLVVDAVTSLGAHPVNVDQRGIDVCYSGTQKALSAPPGLAPITFSARALDRLSRRKSPVPAWYLDAALLSRYWGSERMYHHTISAPLVYAIHEALAIIAEEGLPARAERHAANQRAFQEGLEAVGLQLHANPNHRLWTLTTVRVPEGIEMAAVQQRLLDNFDIEIGGGIGQLKGQVWRIGQMGYGSSRRNTFLLLSALTDTLKSLGYACQPDAAITAAGSAYTTPAYATI